jgi:hypothetical protein
MSKRNCFYLPFFLLIIGPLGCVTKQPSYSAIAGNVLAVQRDVFLYRNKVHIWPAKGIVIITKDDLLFIPTPYYGINIGNRDTTSVNLKNIDNLREFRSAFSSTFGLDVITKDGKNYSFVTRSPQKLLRDIQRVKE